MGGCGETWRRRDRNRESINMFYPLSFTLEEGREMEEKGNVRCMSREGRREKGDESGRGQGVGWKDGLAPRGCVL